MLKKKTEITEIPFVNESNNQHNDSEWFKLYLDSKRYILLFDEISSDSSKEICSKLISFNFINNKKPIYLEINSVGGSVSDGFAIVNTIRKIQAPVITIINGEACSMAAMISIVGNKKYIYYNSYWMQHPTSDMIAEDVQKIKDRAKYLSEFEAKMEELMKQCTSLTKKDLAKIRTGELWLNAKQCLKKKIVDEIIFTTKRRKTKTNLLF